MSFQRNSDEDTMPRRRFLIGAWAVSLITLTGQSLTSLLSFFKPMVDAGSFGGKVSAGRVDEFTVGSVTHVQKGRFYISRQEDGVLAMWHRCTHLGCTVPWSDDEGQFHCPCHGGLYDTKGVVLGGPPPRPLDLFPIEIVDGEIIVDTSQAIQRKSFDPSQVTPV